MAKWCLTRGGRQMSPKQKRRAHGPASDLLFGGVWSAGGEERWQAANVLCFAIGTLGAGFSSGGAAAAGAAFAWLAGFAFGGFDGLFGRRLGGHFSGCRCGWSRGRIGRWLCCGGSGRRGLLGYNRASLLHFAFGAEALAAIAAITTFLARLAFAILALGAWRALLALLAILPVAFALLFAFGGHILLLWLRLGRGEARVHLGHIIIVIVVLLPLGPLAALRLLGARNDAEIMLGVLQVIFCHDRIAARLSIACQLQVFFRHMGGIAAHLHVGAIALEIAR